MFIYCNGSYKIGDCLPGNVRYNVQIISGQEYGYLENTATGETGYQLTDLLPEWELDDSNFNRGRFDSLRYVSVNNQLSEPQGMLQLASAQMIFQ